MVRVYTAATREVAIEYACEDLEVDKKKLSVVKTRNRRKIFGFLGKSKNTEVVVKLKSKLENAIIDFIEHTLSYMNCPARAEVIRRNDNKIFIDIDADYPRILTGKNGEILRALQRLATVFSTRHTKEAVIIVLDVQSHRRKREQQTERLARKAAEIALASGESQLLRPMNSYNRLLAHKTILSIKGVTTRSEGSGSRRRVRVVLDER